jgi:hypothetical protein
MSQHCPRCERTLELPGLAAFCPYCGQSLTATFADVGRTTPPSAIPPPEPAPERLGDYRLLRRLGQGGMGVVYEGEHLPTGRRVAVKLVNVEASDDALERFRQEGKLASAVSHPRCVFVLAADTDAGRPFIVLELMPGRTLDDEVAQRGPLPVEAALGHALDLIEGLEQVHSLGVIHRDVKPSNCFLDHEGRVKVGDFGLARSLAPDVRLTRTGAFVGTPLYASPEQIKGRPLDGRADVYSVCATLFFLLTGRAPHERGDRDALAVMARVVSEDAPPIRSLRQDMPHGLERILTRGLSRERERRPSDLGALRQELTAFRQTKVGKRVVATRLIAYLADAFLLTPPWWVAAVAGEGLTSTGINPAAVGLATLLDLLYFGVPEGLLGWSVGKWLFGLRVWRRGDVEPPGLWRALARCLIWAAVTSWPGAVVAVMLPRTPEHLALVSVLNLVLSMAGVCVLMLPMRRANGYLCLHDLLTGTRVVALPEREEAARFPSRAEQAEPAPSAEERVGPFRVLGEVWRRGDECVLRATDPVLDRPVWLWLRPADRPELPADRREAPHAARPRWLTHGEHGPLRYDAFLVPAGAPMDHAVAVAGKRSWGRAGPILLELAEELCREGAACHDLSQVWLSPEGGVVLIDVPLADGAGLTREDILAEAAVVLLEGKPPEPGRTRPPRAVLPMHAREALLGLPRFGGALDAAAFQGRLAATLDRPSQTERPARLMHLGLMLLTLLVCCAGGPVAMLLFMGMGVTTELDVNLREAHGKLDSHAEAGAALSAALVAPTPHPLQRLLPALALHDHQRPRAELVDAVERAEEVRQARAGRLSFFSRRGLEENRKVAMAVGSRHRPQQSLQDWAQAAADPDRKADLAAEAHSLDQLPRTGMEAFPMVLGLALIAPGVCVLAALVTRRGLRSMVVGLDVARRDGAPAGRLRCAWRALAAWPAAMGPLILAAWVEELYWERWAASGGEAWLLSLASLAWLGSAAVPLLALGLMVWSPARSLHDRLAGTWLVPR